MDTFFPVAGLFMMKDEFMRHSEDIMRKLSKGVEVL